MAIISELHFGPLNSQEDHRTALTEAEQRINEVIFVVNEEQEETVDWGSIEGKPEFFPADPSVQEVQWNNVQGAPEIPVMPDTYTKAQSDARYGGLARDNNWSETNIFEDVASFLGGDVPFVVNSNGLVENLNAQFVGGKQLSELVEQDGDASLNSLEVTGAVFFNDLRAASAEIGGAVVITTGGIDLSAVNPVLALQMPVGAAMVAHLDAEKLGGQLGAFYLDWDNFTDKPTTLAGYGITDAVSDSELSAHATDTTSVHGITDTSVLAVKNADNSFSAGQTILTTGNAEMLVSRSGGASARFQSQVGVALVGTTTLHNFALITNSTQRAEVTTGGHWRPVFDAVSDNGDATHRWRDGWYSRDMSIGRNIVLPAPTTATGATAGADTLPANPVGFLVVRIAGTDRKIPYYAT